MSPAPQPLQERILDVLAESGRVRVKDLAHWVSGVDPIALDCAMSSLMRANKVSRTLGSYDLVRPVLQTDRVNRKAVVETKSNGTEITVAACAGSPAPELVVALAQAVQAKLSEPPTALEEAAASLLADEPDYEQVCEGCEKPFPITQFQLIGRNRVRSRTCGACHGKKSSKGIAERKQKMIEQIRAEVLSTNTPPEASAVSPRTSHETQPLAVADHTAGRTLNGGSGEGGVSLGSNLPTAADSFGAAAAPTPAARSTHTPPPPPPGSTEPPAISSEHLVSASAHGTQPADLSLTNPEALSPVGAGTPLSTAVMLAHLAEKRRRWAMEITALQVAVKTLDELVGALKALGERG